MSAYVADLVLKALVAIFVLLVTVFTIVTAVFSWGWRQASKSDEYGPSYVEYALSLRDFDLLVNPYHREGGVYPATIDELIAEYRARGTLLSPREKLWKDLYYVSGYTTNDNPACIIAFPSVAFQRDPRHVPVLQLFNGINPLADVSKKSGIPVDDLLQKPWMSSGVASNSAVWMELESRVKLLLPLSGSGDRLE